MNINLMAQALAVEITQSVQTTLPGDSGAQGTEFEDMLVKQSQAAKPQRKEETAQDKTNKKQTARRPAPKSRRPQRARKWRPLL